MSPPRWPVCAPRARPNLPAARHERAGHRLDLRSGARRRRPLGTRALLGRAAWRHTGGVVPGMGHARTAAERSAALLPGDGHAAGPDTARVHFDIVVADLASAHDRVIEAGATPAGEHVSPRPGPDGEPVPWRVYRDPAGHLFCLV